VSLLLDTNILVPLVDGTGRNLPASVVGAISDDAASLVASVASIWEVAIKHRLGKLPLPCALEDWPAALSTLNIRVLTVRTAHVIQAVEPPVRVKDPFDRLLMAICMAEGLRLVTTDEALARHPLAWKPPTA
jgi:PIN domain nuclease of toxin-antitoxin system